MGFGILFIGYALTFCSAFFTTYLFADLIGCAVMLGAFIMLHRYNRIFKYPAMATVFLAFTYAAAAAMRFMGYGGITTAELIGGSVYSVIQTYVIPAASLAFYLTLLCAIARIAREVGLTDIANRCFKYIITFLIYSGVYLLFSLISDRVAAASVRVYNVTSAGLTLFIGVWLIMMFLLIMSCMKWIAPAEVIEAEERGEDDGKVLTKIGMKLDRLQKTVNTPREEKEAARLKREMAQNEKLNSKNQK